MSKMFSFPWTLLPSGLFRIFERSGDQMATLTAFVQRSIACIKKQKLEQFG
jgi:hypothetical protein